jgi:D-sedoheptulose 7-phosphate isomerase
LPGDPSLILLASYVNTDVLACGQRSQHAAAITSVGAAMQSLETIHAGSAALDYLADLSSVLHRVPREPLTHAIAVLLEARAHGRRIYVFGNGGSAATASHFVCDLAKTARIPGYAPFRAFALTDSIPSMTAWANDNAFAETFPRMLEAYLEPDDVVIGISASGNSPNVVDGLHLANRLGARTIALLGFDGGKAMQTAEIAVHVPCGHYGLAEDAHSAICHAMTDAIRRTLLAERDRALVVLDEAPVPA